MRLKVNFFLERNITGRVRKLFLPINDDVITGHLLFFIDDSPTKFDKIEKGSRHRLHVIDLTSSAK